MSLMRLFLLSFLTVVIFLTGCVQINAIPGVARSGETIVLGLGGINRNALGNKNLSADDLTITLTDSANVTHTLKVEYVFKVYQDYVSSASVSTVQAEITGINPMQLDSYDGAYFVAVSLNEVDPLNEFARFPLSIATGDATINISSPALAEEGLGLPFGDFEGKFDSISLEILSGVVTWDPDQIKQFEYFSTFNQHFVIYPDPLDIASLSVDQVGGAYFVIDFLIEDQYGSYFTNGVMPTALPSTHHPYIQFSYNIVDHGDDTGTMYITISNLDGFADESIKTANAAYLKDVSANLQVYYATGTASTLLRVKDNFTLNGAASYFFDVNGNKINDLTPLMIHSSDI